MEKNTFNVGRLYSLFCFRLDVSSELATPDAKTRRSQWRSRSLRLDIMTDPEDTFDFEEDELRQSTMSRVSGLAFAVSYYLR